MTAIAEKLDKKLTEWNSDKSHIVELLVSQIIEMADDDTLDLGRSRQVEQEVLDMLDEN
jgi:hypothetical protein